MRLRRSIPQLMAEERGLTVNQEEYDRSMEHQKSQSKRVKKVDTEARLKFEAEATSQLKKAGVATTNDTPK